LFDDDEFIEVYLNCSIEICEQRDPKGLYQKARKGEIKDFTGISAPYEVPNSPELNIETGDYSIEESAQLIIEYLIRKQIIL